MLTLLYFLLPVCAVLLSFFFRRLLSRRGVEIPWEMWYLLFVLPFWAGGFFTGSAPVTCLVLTLVLLRRKPLRLVPCLGAAGVLLLVLGYCLTPLWAADRGMAVFGMARYLPLLPLALLFMQYTPEEKQNSLLIIPLCGISMTLITGLLLLFPETAQAVSVSGRLCGTFQYPNTYAAFLLAGLVILGTRENHTKKDLLAEAVLLTGLFLSGSRTGILLLAVVGLGICVYRGWLKPAAARCIAGAGVLLLAGVLVYTTFNGFHLLGRDLRAVFLRFLYYKDALPVIARHPFGLGYLGYRAMLPTFQGGRYAVSYVHNFLLQLLLDVGWVPALGFGCCLVRTLLSRKTDLPRKLLLATILLHSLLDFHFQFFVFWAILLLLMDFDAKKGYPLSKPAAAGLCLPIVLASLWLGAADGLYRWGYPENTLTIAPFHTDALVEILQQNPDPDQMDALADRILRLNPHSSLVYSAKAAAALSRGQVPAMIQYKEAAIARAPYAISEYTDYLDKLYTVLVRYVETGDHASAAYCLDKLTQIPEWIDGANAAMDPLALKTTKNPLLRLPQEYLDLIQVLKEANNLTS